MTSIWTDTIIHQWISEGITLSPPATIDSILATEDLIGFLFPEDFKELYLRMDGFVDWDWTKTMFSIWPLARILEEYHNESDNNFIVFSDYLINAHQIGFVKGEKGVFKNSGPAPELIADTFSEAIFLIHSDAEIVY